MIWNQSPKKQLRRGNEPRERKPKKQKSNISSRVKGIECPLFDKRFARREEMYLVYAKVISGWIWRVNVYNALISNNKESLGWQVFKKS